MSLEGGLGGVGLTEIADESLRQLAEALESGSLRAPLSPVALEHAGLGNLRPGLAPFQGLDAAGLQLLIRAVLAERTRARHQRLELVWSGADAGVSHARYTKLVIPELIDSAARQITIAGYSFDAGAGIFESLQRAMVERAVTVRFFLDIEQLSKRLEQHLANERRKSRLGPLKAAKSADAELYARQVVSLFLELFWSTTGPRPDIYYDPRTAVSGTYISLHAKCLIVDCERALVTSANFTGRAQSRNIEVGVLIHDKGYAEDLERQWSNLVESGDVVRG